MVVRFANPVEASRCDGSSPVRTLAAAITESFKRETVFMATHVVGRALYDLAPGTQAGRAFTEREVEAAVEATLSLLQDQLHSPLHHLAPSAVISRALQKWHSCHDSGVVRRSGKQLNLCDSALLLYYRNRTAHLL